MKQHKYRTGLLSKGAVAAVVGGVLGIGAGWAQTLNSGAVSQTQAVNDRHIINLQGVEMSALINDVSAITGYTFVVHPSVRGQVTVSSQTPLTTQEVFQVFLSTLRVHGFAAIPGANGVYRIVPEQEGASGAALANPGVTGDQIETAVFRLRNLDPVEAARMIKPVTNPQGQVTASARTNSVIVVDYAGNISRVRDILNRIDEDRSTIATIALENTSAAEMAKTINALNAGTSEAFNYDVGAIPMEAGNTLVLRGDIEDVARVVDIVERLDAEGRDTAETLAVIPLNYAQAAEIAVILESVGARMAAASRPGGEAIAPVIVVHEPTNSLVINADPGVVRQLEQVVFQLDVRRSQVLVEAIVVELSDNATRELGLQFVVGGSEDNSVPFAATNFTRATPNILSIAGALVAPNNLGDGDDDATNDLQDLAISSLLGANGSLFGFGGTTDDGGVFGVIVNAVDDDIGSSILSTPSVLAMDNEVASFFSGQEIPITTGEVLGNNNNNPFRTVEREDTGILLEVQPQISEGDTIRLQLRQEVSAVIGPVTQTSTDLVTSKRELSTTILADDGDIIVLGGLIEETEQLQVSKVPVLGDIPLLGRAFRYDSTADTRTNLMVFLRPTIVRDGETMRNTTETKFNFMVEAQRNATADENSSLQELVDDLRAGRR